MNVFGRAQNCWANYLGEAKNLLYPIQCAGCGKWDQNLCPYCWMIADQSPALSALDGPDAVPQIPLWSLGDYGQELRQIILAAKHDPGRDLDSFLFHSGARLGDSAAMNLAGSSGPIWVVPAPSSWRRRWDRHEITGKIAEGLAAGIQTTLGCALVSIVPAVKLRTGAQSQSSRSQQGRHLGRQGMMRLQLAPPPNTAVVVVDDVATTGATLTEIIRCLGLNVQVAAVLARA